jgi:hypothetical protein
LCKFLSIAGIVSIPGKPGKTVAANVWRRNPKAPKSLAKIDPAEATIGLAVVKDFLSLGRTYADGTPACMDTPHSYLQRKVAFALDLSATNTSEAVDGST